MNQRFFYRNVRARDHLELFLVSAVSSLLLLRFALYLSGYPQVGGHSLHISHMLYGGLLMLIAMTLMLSFIGARIQRLAALLGGIGFGIFIDELGKFITKNNNYFFRPTIGIIYAIFIFIYLMFNFVSRSKHLTAGEYQLNALSQFEEAVVHNMNMLEKTRMRKLLARADKHNLITQELSNLLDRIDTVPNAKPNAFRRLLNRVNNSYEQFAKKRTSSRLIATFFIGEAMVFLLVVAIGLVHSLDSVKDLLHDKASYGNNLLIGQLVTSIIAAVFVIVGASQLPKSRLLAYEQFRHATLVNILLTEFFIFSRIQFGAIPGFLVSLVLLGALRYAIFQEQRLQNAR